MPKRKVENKTIDVILLEADRHLWEKYEIVKVRPVFARNVLFPKNKAVIADAGNTNKYAQKMKAGEESRKKKAHGLEELFMKIQNDNGSVSYTHLFISLYKNGTLNDPIAVIFFLSLKRWDSISIP